MLLEEYLQNPCRMLSIPYWKAKDIIIPNNMIILHNKNFNDSYLNEYIDEKYFRLYHDFKNINKVKIEGFKIVTASEKDIRTIVDIVNKSYINIKATKKQFIDYTKTRVYSSALWVLAKEISTENAVGCGIADYDAEANEMILEWIQVLPEYRGKGIGQMIVNELLNRGKRMANFATVSGKTDNPTNPEKLYRRCGFKGDDVWHILIKSSD